MKRSNENFNRNVRPKQSRFSLRQVNVHTIGLCGNIEREGDNPSFDTYTPSKCCEIKSNIKRFLSSPTKNLSGYILKWTMQRIDENVLPEKRTISAYLLNAHSIDSTNQECYCEIVDAIYASIFCRLNHIPLRRDRPPGKHSCWIGDVTRDESIEIQHKFSRGRRERFPPSNKKTQEDHVPSKKKETTTQGSKKVNVSGHEGAWGKTSNNFVRGWTIVPKKSTLPWGKSPNTTFENSSGWGKGPKSSSSKLSPSTFGKIFVELSDSEPASSKENEFVKEDSNDTQSFTKIAKTSEVVVKKQDINRQTNQVMMENLKATWNKEPGTIEDLVAENEKKRKKVVENEEELEDLSQDEWGKNRKRQKLLDIGWKPTISPPTGVQKFGSASETKKLGSSTVIVLDESLPSSEHKNNSSSVLDESLPSSEQKNESSSAPPLLKDIPSVDKENVKDN